MTGNYKSLVYKICPNAVVTVDRFHVTKIVHEELNGARIAEKKIASELNAPEREKVFESLKGNKFTILKAENKLTEKQKDKEDTSLKSSFCSLSVIITKLELLHSNPQARNPALRQHHQFESALDQ